MFAMNQPNVPLACKRCFATLAYPFLTLLMGVVWPARIQAAQPRSGQTAMLCEAVYMPAQTVWPRTVAIEYDQRRIKAVSIDGVKVYTFNVRDTWILTSMDNERIQINTATLAWTSDFRGLATAQGRCDWLQP